ncbi:MAG: coproporphyrinogen-III oxidase family protein [Acidobacteriota bacterium]
MSDPVIRDASSAAHPVDSIAQPADPNTRAPADFEVPDHGKTEVGSVFVSNYPPFSFWSPDQNENYLDAVGQPARPDAPLGLYMHIPFCRKRCKFCYFRVYVDRNAEQIQRYLDALAREVEHYAAQPVTQNRPLDFVYFGGGTPSYIAAKHLRALVDRVKAVMPWDRAKEVTFECEPGTLTATKVETIRDIGVTRISLGIENWDPEILEINGRAHRTEEIHRCLPWIRAQDFPQLNVDLIAGLVGETWDNWRETVDRTLEIEPDSLTIYQMELPFNTVFSRGILRDDEDAPQVADWALKREWHDYAIETFTQAGYIVSSGYTLLKPGKDASAFRYRDALWHGADLLGTGIASFGHVSGVHGQNLSGWDPYLSAVEAGELPLNRAYALGDDEKLTRELILQLKLGRVDLAALGAKFDVDVAARYATVFDAFAAQDLMHVVDDGRAVALTRAGLLQVDMLLPSFYAERHQNARYT